MKKLVAVFAVLALAFVAPARASADDTTQQPSVTVGDFGQYVVQKGKKTTVEPEVITQGAVVVVSAKLTVTHGKKTVARNAKSVKLRAGSYQVTTTVQWMASGNPAVNTTVATKPLRISTFSASKEAKALLASMNAARRKNQAITDFMDRYHLDYSALTLRRSSTLDKVATSWSKKSAKKGKYTSPEWSKVPSSYEWAWYLPVKTRNPYRPTLSQEAAQWFADGSDPTMSCGAHDDGDDVVADCGDSVGDALWSRLGLGFAWDKKGWLWVTLILATHK
jgi:hypothetical protein